MDDKMADSQMMGDIQEDAFNQGLCSGKDSMKKVITQTIKTLKFIRSEDCWDQETAVDKLIIELTKQI